MNYNEVPIKRRFQRKEKKKKTVDNNLVPFRSMSKLEMSPNMKDCVKVFHVLLIYLKLHSNSKTDHVLVEKSKKFLIQSVR